MKLVIVSILLVGFHLSDSLLYAGLASEKDKLGYQEVWQGCFAREVVALLRAYYPNVYNEYEAVGVDQKKGVHLDGYIVDIKHKNDLDHKRVLRVELMGKTESVSLLDPQTSLAVDGMHCSLDTESVCKKDYALVVYERADSKKRYLPTVFGAHNCYWNGFYESMQKSLSDPAVFRGAFTK